MRPEEIGKRLQMLRVSRNLKAKDVAVAVGLNPKTVSKIENGKRLVRADEVPKFAAALGVPIESITGPAPEPLPAVTDQMRGVRTLAGRDRTLAERIVRAVERGVEVDPEGFADLLESAGKWREGREGRGR